MVRSGLVWLALPTPGGPWCLLSSQFSRNGSDDGDHGREDASGFSEDIPMFAKYKPGLEALSSKNDPNGSPSKSAHSEPSVLDINSCALL